MCGSNPFCSTLDGTCSCSQRMASQSLMTSPLILFSVLRDQRSVLEEILQSLHCISENLKTHKTPDSSSSNHIRCEVSSPDHVLASISKSSSYTFKLKIVNSPPCTLYKDRNWSLKFAIVDNADKSVTLSNNERFRLGVFTADYPPTELFENTSGGRILKGNSEVYGSKEVEFRKFSITEVSSHYRNSVFYLVVVTENNSLVKPLVISELNVKARKTSDKLTKHPKLQENTK